MGDLALPPIGLAAPRLPLLLRVQVCFMWTLCFLWLARAIRAVRAVVTKQRIGLKRMWFA